MLNLGILDINPLGTLVCEILVNFDLRDSPTAQWITMARWQKDGTWMFDPGNAVNTEAAVKFSLMITMMYVKHGPGKVARPTHIFADLPR